MTDRARGAVNWDLRLGDCLDPVTGLASLADESVDHTISDPPYSADLYARTRTNKGTRANRMVKDGGKSAIELAALRIGSCDDVIGPVSAQLIRVTRRWALVFCDEEITHRWRDSLGGRPWRVRTGAWVKTDPMPQISGDRPAQGHEPIVISHRPGKKRWNGGGRPAIWICGTCKGSQRPDHPCPKPLELMDALVRDFTDPGDLILDPFAGSGTTGVAAIRLGRRFIGWERDEKYHAIAIRRLTTAREQLSIFDKAAP